MARYLRSKSFPSLSGRRIIATRNTRSFVDVANTRSTENYTAPAPDIRYHNLATSVSKELGFEYLSPAPKLTRCQPEPKPVEGILYGQMMRPIVSMTASHNGKSVHVHFLVESASPATFLSHQAIKSLLGREYSSEEHLPVIYLNGTSLVTQQGGYWFSGLNLLGADFLQLNNARVERHCMWRAVVIRFR